jgi:invasion protein IalB
MAKNTELDGTIQLPDGRTIPVIVTLDIGDRKPVRRAQNSVQTLEPTP